LDGSGHVGADAGIAGIVVLGPAHATVDASIACLVVDRGAVHVCVDGCITGIVVVSRSSSVHVGAYAAVSCIVVVVHGSVHIVGDRVAVHVDHAAADAGPRHVVLHAVTADANWKASLHSVLHSCVQTWPYGSPRRAHACVFTLFAHTIYTGPDAFSQPAYLAENFFTAHHLLLAVARGCNVCELIDECARGFDEFDKGGGYPIWQEGLMEGDNVRFGGHGRDIGGEGCRIVPGGAVTL